MKKCLGILAVLFYGNSFSQVSADLDHLGKITLVFSNETDDVKIFPNPFYLGVAMKKGKKMEYCLRPRRFIFRSDTLFLFLNDTLADKRFSPFDPFDTLKIQESISKYKLLDMHATAQMVFRVPDYKYKWVVIYYPFDNAESKNNPQTLVYYGRRGDD